MTSFKQKPNLNCEKKVFSSAPSTEDKSVHFKADLNLHAELMTADDPVYQDIYEQAKQRGYQDGLDHSRQEITVKQQQLSSLLDELRMPLEIVDEEIMNRVTNIVFTVAKQVIQRELQLDSGIVVSAVRQAIAALPATQIHTLVRVNPVDKPMVEKIFENSSDTTHFEVIEDPAIAIGGCKVCTEFAEVDATVETRIATIVNQVLGGRRAHDRE